METERASVLSANSFSSTWSKFRQVLSLIVCDRSLVFHKQVPFLLQINSSTLSKEHESFLVFNPLSLLIPKTLEVGRVPQGTCAFIC